MVNKVDRLADVPIQMAKARVGAAVKHAIGEQGAKQYGDKGLISNVTSGEKVPEYLARIYADPEARRRFALAWLEGAEGVELETTVRIKRTA